MEKYSTLIEILEKYLHLIEKEYVNTYGEICLFVGISIDKDDVYYQMWGLKNKFVTYYSCSFDLEHYGFKLKEK